MCLVSRLRHPRVDVGVLSIVFVVSHVGDVVFCAVLGVYILCVGVAEPLVGDSVLCVVVLLYWALCTCCWCCCFMCCLLIRTSYSVLRVCVYVSCVSRWFLCVDVCDFCVNVFLCVLRVFSTCFLRCDSINLPAA